MKKTETVTRKYLEKRPVRSQALSWSTGTDGTVTLEVENRGMMNRIAQKLLGKPKVSYIHLDEMGSFLWCNLDGSQSILGLGDLVDARFGQEARPLYTRLARYMQILESYRFISWA